MGAAILLVTAAVNRPGRACGQAEVSPRKGGEVVAPPLDESAAKASESRKRGHITGPAPFTVGVYSELHNGYGTADGRLSLVPTDNKRRMYYNFPAHKGRLSALVLTPTDVFTGGADGKIKSWSVRSVTDFVDECEKAGRGADKVPTPKPRAIMEGHPGGVLSLAYDGQAAVLYSSGKDSVVRAWDPTTGHSLHTVCKHRGAIASISLRADARALAVLTDKQVYIYELPEPRLVVAVDHGLAVPRAVALAPDGKVVAVAGGREGEPGQILLFDTVTATRTGQLNGHLDTVPGIAFHPKLPRLASAGRDHALRCWDVATRKELFNDRHPETITDVRYSADGKWLATTSPRLVQFWRGDAGAEGR